MTIQNQIHLKIRKAFSVRLLGTRMNTCSIVNGERLVCDRGGASGCHLNFSSILSSRVRARQEVFVFCLHLFTGRAQLICAQRNKGEGFCPSTFTLPFTLERESAMLPLLLRNMHKCRPQITYSREGAGEDLGEGERPFLRKTFTPNSLTYCKM